MFALFETARTLISQGVGLPSNPLFCGRRRIRGMAGCPRRNSLLAAEADEAVAAAKKDIVGRG